MNDQSDPLPEALKAIQGSIAYHQAQLAKLQAVEAMLNEGLALAPAKPNWPATPSGNAPRFVLANAIKDVLGRAKAPMGNEAIRSALKALGYPYSLDPMHLGKTLAVMVGKELKREGRNRTAKYFLK